MKFETQKKTRKKKHKNTRKAQKKKTINTVQCKHNNNDARPGRVNHKLVVNPSPDTFSPTGWKDGGGLDLLYAANEHRALMIEMGGGPIDENLLESALALAHEHVSGRKAEWKRGAGNGREGGRGGACFLAACLSGRQFGL